VKAVYCGLFLFCATALTQDRQRVFVTDSNSGESSGGFASLKDGGGGSFSGGARPQTVEIMKTFPDRCPAVQVTNDRSKSNFIVVLDHEGGKGYVRKDTKIAVFEKTGDMIIAKSTRSLGVAVKDACQAIVSKKLQTSADKAIVEQGLLVIEKPMATPAAVPMGRKEIWCGVLPANR